MRQKFLLIVNGKVHSMDIDPDMPPLYALRNDIGLNKPRFGCGLAQCGAGTVHLDGELIRSSSRRSLPSVKGRWRRSPGSGHLTSRIRCRPAERTNIQPIKLP